MDETLIAVGRTLTRPLGEFKQGMDISYKGIPEYHPSIGVVPGSVRGALTVV